MYNMRVILNLEQKMAEYITQQKKTLLGYLAQHSERSFTVEELTDGIKKMKKLEGRAPGKSTVYRLMTRFVEEGTVKRFVRGHSRRFVYQIVSGERCSYHLHMKCTSCGRLLHLDEGLSDELMSKVKKLCDFSVSETDTVLFGVCADCSSKR